MKLRANRLHSRWCVLFMLGLIAFFQLPVLGYYQPETGRFMQRDPLGVNPMGDENNPFAVQKQYSDSMNIYEYVRSNVMSYVDPFGTILPTPDGGGYNPPGGWPKEPIPVDSKDLDQIVENMIASLMESTYCAGMINNLVSCEAACIGDCMNYQKANLVAVLGGVIPNTIPPIITGKIKNCCPIPRKVIRASPTCPGNTTNWQKLFQSLSPEAKKMFGLKFFKVLGRINVGITVVSGMYDSWAFGYCSTWCQDNPGKQKYNPNVPIKWW